MSFHAADDDSAERYAVGSLSLQEREAFEQHLLACARCRREVTMASAIRVELAHSRGSKRRWIVAASAALAASLAVALIRTSGTSVTRFGEVRSAPAYEAVAVRSNPSVRSSSFDSAMIMYKAARYAEAATGLRRARSSGADSVAASFFLGASLLMSGHPQEAAAEFSIVTALGHSVYEAESHFYRAKALLQTDQRDAAITELTKAAALSGAIQLAAKSLLDSVRAER